MSLHASVAAGVEGVAQEGDENRRGWQKVEERRQERAGWIRTRRMKRERRLVDEAEWCVIGGKPCGLRDPGAGGPEVWIEAWDGE